MEPNESRNATAMTADVQPSKRILLNRSQKAWTYAVTGATLIGLTATILTLFNARESSVETLTARNSQGAVAATQEEDFRVIGELEDPLAFYQDNSDNFPITWQIPTSAPFHTFPEAPEPSGDHRACSGAQLEWLTQHAQTNSASGFGSFNLTLQNTAESGGAVALTNIRFDGEEVTSKPLVHFSCPIGGLGATGGQQMYIGTEGQPAEWGPGFGIDAKPEGSLVTINLSPGEATGVSLVRAPEVDTQRQFKGRFLATIEGEPSETVIVANDVHFRRETLPGYFVGYGPKGFVDGKLYCGVPFTGPRFAGDEVWQYASDTTPCTLSEAADILKQAKEASTS